MPDQNDQTSSYPTQGAEKTLHATPSTPGGSALNAELTAPDALPNDELLLDGKADNTTSQAPIEDAPNRSQESTPPARKRKRSEILLEKVREREKETEESRRAEVALKRQLQGARRREENELVRTQQILIGRWYLELAYADPEKFGASVARLITMKLRTPKEHEAVSELYTKFTGKVLPVPPDPDPGAANGRRKKPD
ncbi:hypothetical protein [Microvirga sp. VF16]|uniref:hypothetical protein n=1 Tax=Microvirga sp. VF16 TaxID=2807101 RepID=UPI00193E3FAD|nr:hypothetical protein [Microvirga sp. VF16]QRM33489.1 hypothetical protein JO965_36230 [Microvirga sp. VF16]